LAGSIRGSEFKGMPRMLDIVPTSSREDSGLQEARAAARRSRELIHARGGKKLMDSASAAEPPSRTKEAKSRVEVTWAVKPSPLRPPGSLPSQAPVRIKKSMTGSAKSAPFQTAKPCRLERRCGGVYDSGAGDSTIAPDFIKWVCPLARSPDDSCRPRLASAWPFPLRIYARPDRHRAPDLFDDRHQPNQVPPL
jgi:hypothetical protein